MSVRDYRGCSENAVGVKLTLENFETLWDIFSQTPCLQLKKIIYYWIVYRSYNPTYNYFTFNINIRFNNEFRHEIFSNFLCDPRKLSIRTMDNNEFIVFKEFLIYVNNKAGAFEVKPYQLGTSPNSASRRILRVKSNEIKGL